MTNSPKQTKVAVLFSGTRPPGIGPEVATRLADAGCTVVCVDNVIDGRHGPSSRFGDAARLDALIAELEARGCTARKILADVTQPGVPEQVVADVVESHGSIDVACIFTGATGPGFGQGAMLSVEAADMQAALHLNLVVPFLVARACARRMVEQNDATPGRGGAIVFQSSHAAVVPTPGNGAFGAARAGLNHLVSLLGREWGPHNIRINAVNPFAIAPDGDVTRNPGLMKFLQDSGAADINAMAAKMIPLQRAQTPAETATVMAFLALEATFVTGESWTVSGGSN